MSIQNWKSQAVKFGRLANEHLVRRMFPMPFVLVSLGRDSILAQT